MSASELAPYFMITCSDDGEIRVRKLSEAEAVLSLATDEDTGALTCPPYRWDEEFDPDPLYWNGRCLIIRGAVVSAQPVAVKYELR